jgi:Zn-dependent protease
LIPSSETCSEGLKPLLEERRPKIYTSFQDLSPREYMYIPEGQLEVGRPGSFSRIEVLHLSVAMVVLTVAFALVFSANQIYHGFSLGRFAVAIPVSLLGMTTGFILHEFGHKFTAQRLGLWSEFRIYPQGLLISLLLAVFTPFVIAAPGAVVFRGNARVEDTGRIAVAGPLVNILVAVVMFVLIPVVGSWSVNGVNLDEVLIFVCFINALLAVFNLLPLGPLDGRKILSWNGLVWAGLMAGALVLVVVRIEVGVLFPGI